MNPYLPNSTPPMDLSGRTPIYRLSQVEQSWPQVPTPSPSYVSPYRAQQQQQQQEALQQQQASQDQPSPTQNDIDADATADSPAEHEHEGAEGAVDTTPASSKRRGRKLLEEQVLVLFNCCLERQQLYISQDRTRFWMQVASKLKQLTRRSFAWQSCRRIVTDRTLERRVHRREIDVGRRTEPQPPPDLSVAIDQWIAMEDQMEQQITAALTGKRPAPMDVPVPVSGEAPSGVGTPGGGAPAVVVPGTMGAGTIPRPGAVSGPERQAKRVKQASWKESLAESLIKLSESITEPDTDATPNEMLVEVRDTRRGMDEIRRSVEDVRKEINALRTDMNRKFELVIQLLTEMKEQE